MLWQSAFSRITFFSVLWPDLSSWHIFSTIFYFQRQYSQLQKARQEYSQWKEHSKEIVMESPHRKQRVEIFQKKVEMALLEYYEHLLQSGSSSKQEKSDDSKE
jgi:hypothetical protein